LNKDIERFALDVVENSNDWLSLLEDLSTSDTYMKWSWGEYKSNSGWQVKRIGIVDSTTKKVVACCQLQLKHKLFIDFYMIQGGVHISRDCRVKNIYDCVYQAIVSYIKDNSNLWLLLVNYQSHQIDNAEISLMKSGFSPILTNRMFTYLILNNDINTDLSFLSKNWRHNLKRAKNNNITVEYLTSYKDRLGAMSNLEVMYDQLIIRKNFIQGINLANSGSYIVEDDSFIIVQAKLENKVIAIRVASVCNDHLLDFVAASNNGAIKSYANYLLMWEMILKTKELGKEYFDTGGIEPSSNLGVFNFKKGLNGELVINGPLWCKGSNYWLEKVAQIFLS